MARVVGTVVGFAGAIGSGKTSLSRAVASDLACTWVSFGDYVRKEATDRGCAQDRRSLQLVGESLIQEGWVKFCLGVLSQADWRPGQNLVIDGIRHADGVLALTSLVEPSTFHLVGTSLDSKRRWARKCNGGAIAREVARSVESHSTEIEVESRVIPSADLVVDGSRPVEELVREIVDWLSTQ